ncbi:hypothetical protein [Pseudomonas viridiflava]|uniref:hypothetical protein n=1 Tax=Pseudomonas viridiflava TaxID=33069 RepID=UPI000F01FFA0|nr:hypothetical protein [Pseudomonas viridiflava]
MIKLDLGHVVKTFVQALLPAGSPGTLAIALRVDTWLNIDEDWLKPEAREAFLADPTLYLKHCQVNHRYHEVLVFRCPNAHTQVYLQQNAENPRQVAFEGIYAKVADHDSQWIDGLDEIQGNALKVIETLREDAKSYVLPEFAARLRPGQTVCFAQHPVLINPTSWRLDDAGNLTISQ